MQLRLGFEMAYWCYQETAMIVQLNIHHSRAADLVQPDLLRTDPVVPLTAYHDGFGNWCTRLVAPPGRFVLTADAIINDAGKPDPIALDAAQIPVKDLPDETLVYLLGSRYCDTEQLSNFAWQKFGSIAPGWGRVQAICDFVHQHIQFGYQYARPTKTAFDAFNEAQGVCRDFAHLGLTLCRCMNIPARYCTGYITDIGIEPAPTAPMDFAGWFEAYLGDRWYTFDPRNNAERIGRTVMARGRDACDVALVTSFATHTVEKFVVWADEYKPT